MRTPILILLLLFFGGSTTEHAPAANCAIHCTMASQSPPDFTENRLVSIYPVTFFGIL